MLREIPPLGEADEKAVRRADWWAMERQWKVREKQIEWVITNTVGMYGEMSGILGGTLPSIPALELDGVCWKVIVSE